MKSSFMYSIILMLGLYAQASWATLSYIKNGYISCTACHSNPNGGGILTPYGKGIASSMSFLKDPYSKGSLRKALGLKGKMDHNLQIRYAALKKKDESFKSFPMQADYINEFKITKKLRFNTTIARVPNDPPLLDDSANAPFDKILVRRFNLTYKPFKRAEFTLGRDLLNLGLGILDHTAYIKNRNRLDVDDVQTLLRFNYWGKKFLVNTTIFAPSYQEDDANAESGIANTLEYKLPISYLTIGSNLLYGETDAIDRSLYGVFSRFGYKKFVLLGEFDITRRKVKANSISFNQYTSLLKASFYPVEYLNFSVKFETLKVKEPFYEEAIKYGPEFGIRVSKNLSLHSIFYKEDKKEGEDGEVFLSQIFLNGW